MRIEQILTIHGPLLRSSEVAIMIEKHQKVSSQTARKQISRSSGKVEKIKGLLPKNEVLLYLTNSYNSERYWECLLDVILSQKSAYSAALGVLINRGGVVPYDIFKIASGAPQRQSKQLSPRSIVDVFKRCGICEEREVQGLGNCIVLNNNLLNSSLISSEKLTANILVESIFIDSIADWLRKMSLVSYKQVRVRGDVEGKNMVGTLFWDITAPSYLYPLMNLKKEKGRQGFVACDIYLGNEITLAGASAFVKKCNLLRGLKKINPCLQLFIADSFDKEAFIFLKKAGVIPTTPDIVFGEDVAKALRNLCGVLEASVSEIDLDKFSDYFNILAKIEGPALTLRGAFFEILSARLAEHLYGRVSVTINSKFKSLDGKKVEVDVVADTSNDVYFIECKGYKQDSIIPHKEVERWCEHSIPVIRKYASEHADKWGFAKHHFEFWTTGRLSKESIKLIKKENKKSSRYEVQYKENRDIHTAAYGSTGICKNLKEHFMG